MIPPPIEPKKAKISRLTFMGVDPDMDKEFQDFLEFMGISYSIKEEGEWPLVEYEGIPYDIKGMLISRFGMTEGEIEEEYPQLFS
jgi:hypothetical protein